MSLASFVVSNASRVIAPAARREVARWSSVSAFVACASARCSPARAAATCASVPATRADDPTSCAPALVKPPCALASTICSCASACSLLRPSLRELPLRLLHARRVLRVVELQERLPGRHWAVLFDEHALNGAAHARRECDGVRLDLRVVGALLAPRREEVDEDPYEHQGHDDRQGDERLSGAGLRRRGARWVPEGRRVPLLRWWSSVQTSRLTLGFTLRASRSVRRK